MKRNTFEHFFSNSRLNKYLQHSANDWRKAIAFYRSNLRLSQAFYPLLSIIEISLRNALNNSLAKHFSDTSWLLSQRQGFMNNNQLNSQSSRFYMRNRIAQTLSKFNNSISHDKLICELNFSFWTLFFERIHYRLVLGTPIQIFHFKPSYVSRQNIYNILNEIRKFRNRIYHYEPICFSSTDIDFSLAEDIHKKIYLILSWLNPELKQWTKFVDIVDYELLRFKNHRNNNSLIFNINAFLLKLRFIIFKFYLSIKFERYD